MNDRTISPGKSILHLLLCVVLILTVIVGHAPVSRAADCRILVNGEEMESDAEPVIINGRTMVPIANIVKYLGGTASWDQSALQATIAYEQTKIVLTISVKSAYVNGVPYTLDVAPYVQQVNPLGGGRTMVPLRFIGESLGYEVDWLNDERIVTIDSPKSPDDNQDPDNTQDPDNNQGNKDNNGNPDNDQNDPDNRPDQNDPSAKATAITSVEIYPEQTYNDRKYTYVTITGNGQLKDTLTSNAWLTYDESAIRYLVDFYNLSFGEGVENLTLDQDTSCVKGVRAGIDGTRTRIVIDLKSKTTDILSFSQDGTKIFISFPETTSGTDPGTGNPDNTGNGSGTVSSTFKQSTTRTAPTTGGSNVVNALGYTKVDSFSSYKPFADGKIVVCIDPGHGQTTGGKRSFDGTLMEWEFNRDVAYRLKSLLEAQGIQTIMTVPKNATNDPSLKERVMVANNAGNVDLFVSVHANAYGSTWNSANGWEVYSWKSGGVSEYAAKAVESATSASSAITLKDRGCKTANFYVIKNTNMPAILIEHGFYTNSTEVEKLKSSTFRQALAQADCDGIVKFFKSF